MRMMWAVVLASIAMSGAYAAPASGDARLQEIAKPWVERFEAERVLDGFGSGRGVMKMDILVTEGEYRDIARRLRWGPLPRAIQLDFAEGVSGPSVSTNARPQIRIFPHRDRALRLTNEAALGGRIMLRDGCLYVVGRNQRDRLAYFPREFGIATDGKGQLVIRRRTAGGGIVGRVGDQFTWGGPIGISEDWPMVAELRAQCGNAPIEHVGMLVTQEEFRRRYGGPKTSN